LAIKKVKKAYKISSKTRLKEPFFCKKMPYPVKLPNPSYTSMLGADVTPKEAEEIAKYLGTMQPKQPSPTGNGKGWDGKFITGALEKIA
jgi:hypothetical protein